MTKWLLFGCIQFCFLYSSVAQSEDTVVAKYKDGTFYSGLKIDQKSDTVYCQINTGDTISFDINNLKKYYSSQNARIFPSGKYVQTKGYFMSLSLGFNLISGFSEEDQRTSSHLELILGYRINPRFNLGAGVGFEFNEIEIAGFRIDTQVSSIYGYGRYYFLDIPERPFLFARLGFSGAAEEQADTITNEQKGGPQGMIGIGLHFASRRNSKFQMSLGFYTQEVSGREFFLDNIGNEIQVDYDVMIKRLIFKFGWEFG